MKFDINDALNDKGFMEISSNIINNELYLKNKEFYHHGKVTVYTHSIHVAYMCYLYSIKKKKIKKEELVIAALLHDYFLYDWHQKKKYNRKGLHGFTHAKVSAMNAKRDFCVSDFVYDCIISHMFPLNLFRIPKSREAFILSVIDKKCSIKELIWK